MNPDALAAGAPAWTRYALPALAILAAIACGVVLSGDQGPIVLAGAALVALVLVAAMFAMPRIGFYLVLAQISVFPALPLFSSDRGVNPIDLILPITLVGTWFWTRPGPRGKAAGVGDRSRARIKGGALAYYGVALFSLVVLAISGRPLDAFDSLLVLSRSVEGALFFYLVTRLVRTPAELRMARNAVLAGLAIALIFNGLSMALHDVPRAGAVWVHGDPLARGGAAWSVGIGGWVVTNPNELAMACLLGTALILAIPMNRFASGLVLLGCLALLLLTLSRGGLLAWLVLVGVYGMRGGQRWLWLLPLAVLVAFPILPDEFRTRMIRTVTLQKGSFEAYSSLIRFLSWHSSWRVFLAHPIFGVGYLGFRFVSEAYNPLGAYLLTSENFFIETASGMGVVGLAALAYFVFSVLRAARSIRRSSPPGSVGHRMARITPPFLLALGIANLTGDLLTGLLVVSQLAVFLGFLVQARSVEEPLAGEPVTA
jgi:O-antigen ligase